MSLDIGLYVKVDTGGSEKRLIFVYNNNYTHNVIPMWRKSRCYHALYFSDGKKAKEVLPELKQAIEYMEADPQEYIAMSPENGWGDYSSALKFLKQTYIAFKQNPKAIIHVSK